MVQNGHRCGDGEQINGCLEQGGEEGACLRGRQLKSPGLLFGSDESTLKLVCSPGRITDDATNYGITHFKRVTCLVL